MAGASSPPMVGVISLSLSTICERIQRCMDMGYRDFQITLPPFGSLEDDATIDTFFKETCGRFRECRFMHYNCGRTGRKLEPLDYKRLHDAHPNLVSHTHQRPV